MLGGREDWAGWWAWEHYPGREEVWGVGGAVGDWRRDLVNQSAENNSRDFDIYYEARNDYTNNSKTCFVYQMRVRFGK